MLSMIAHLTPLETPVVWLAFAAGLACGILGTLVVARRAVRQAVHQTARQTAASKTR